MTTQDPLHQFESLSAYLTADHPPAVHVTAQVVRRIRQAQAVSERTFTLLAAGSCAAAILVAMIGLAILSGTTDPLEAVFQIVPPITL